MTDYNGWRNWETWNCKLWLDNDGTTQSLEAFTMEHVATTGMDREDTIGWLTEYLELWFQEQIPDEVQGFMRDLILGGLQSVSWLEIAESIIDDSEEINFSNDD